VLTNVAAVAYYFAVVLAVAVDAVLTVTDHIDFCPPVAAADVHYSDQQQQQQQ